jgi:hypothetical protein
MMDCIPTERHTRCINTPVYISTKSGCPAFTGAVGTAEGAVVLVVGECAIDGVDQGF